MSVTPLRASIRPPLVDGLFYPAKGDALSAMIEDLGTRCAAPAGASIAVISPHAGYEYAGTVMATAFRAMSLRPVRTAVLIGQVHRDPAEGIYLPESEAFSTPLGEIPVDTAAVEALCACDPVFRRYDLPHLEEHCLEVQLPFLAHLFPGVSIVPMLVGSGDAATVAALTRALRLTFEEGASHTAFIVSANMASYMTGKNPDAEAAALEELITDCNWRGVLEAAEKRRISTCGAAGIAALLALAGDGCRVRILARSSSNGVDSDPSRIVHYAAASLDLSFRQDG